MKLCQFDDIFLGSRFIPKFADRTVIIAASGVSPMMLKEGMVKVPEMKGKQWEFCCTGHILVSSGRVQTKGEVFPSTRINFACG